MAEAGVASAVPHGYHDEKTYKDLLEGKTQVQDPRDMLPDIDDLEPPQPDLSEAQPGEVAAIVDIAVGPGGADSGDDAGGGGDSGYGSSDFVGYLSFIIDEVGEVGAEAERIGDEERPLRCLYELEPAPTTPIAAPATPAAAPATPIVRVDDLPARPVQIGGASSSAGGAGPPPVPPPLSPPPSPADRAAAIVPVDVADDREAADVLRSSSWGSFQY